MALSILLPAFAFGLLVFVVQRYRQRRRRRGGAFNPGNGSEYLAEALLAVDDGGGPPRHTFDVFLSYRRADFAICDLTAALLELEGVRVFKDRAGHMAGRPFDQAIARAIMESTTFTPVITLAGTQSLLEVSESSVHFVLIEYILALHFQLGGRIDRIYPLLVGAEDAADSAAAPRRDLLNENEEWRRARAQLPDIVPRACIEKASALLRIVADEPLAACLGRATVRQLMCASAASDSSGEVLAGILTHDWCVLTGLQQDISLYVQKRFAANILAAR